MWEFWIDVGGTFTDCIARSPNGELRTFKTLSSGVTRGRVDRVEADGLSIRDGQRVHANEGTWNGYEARFTDDAGREIGRATVLASTGDGCLRVDALPDAVSAGTTYDLSSGEEAPILAIRRVLGLRLDEPLPPLVLKLGTTRGTNALLERKGARTAFVTTRGFADVLLIGNQDRPRLFDLAIEKPSPLFERVVEIDERLDAAGHVLREPEEPTVRAQLELLRSTGVESVAICLLHAYVDGRHELLVERIARDVGFTEISVSHRLAPLQKIVSRGDTTVVDAYLNPVLRAYVGRIEDRGQRLGDLPSPTGIDPLATGEIAALRTQLERLVVDGAPTRERGRVERELALKEIDCLERHLFQHPGDRLGRFELGRRYLRFARHAEAVPLLVDGLDAAPDTPEALLTFAKALIGKRESDEARVVLEEALRSSPTDPATRTEIEYFLRKLGRETSDASPPTLQQVRDGHSEATRSAIRLRLMTSAGGLVSADRFVGKDSILSGPAGGVIGFSRVAERAGFPRSIGFDMGGTSTDVARFDGTYEREFETTKAGVRVVAPMLAIETVAAGGGSVCGFDGVKLFVGPESAGADPGPSCYGLGGPLTVTDVNVFLGKVLPGRFPFPLDRDAVERRLVELCKAIADSPLGRTYTPVELAEGFTAIANANMTRAIRRISVAKGYDPADYALVTFGGAGAQHACAIATSLGIRSVLIHPFAGILSAYGIGLADVRRHRERSILAALDDERLARLDDVFTELEREATDEVRAEQVSDDRIDWPSRSLELRYAGTDATILVTDPEADDWATAFVDRHRELYGYVHRDRPIEVVNARVEVVGRMPEPAEPTREPVPRRPEPTETTRTWFAGTEHDTAVFVRDDLHPGDELPGPAIVVEPTSTIVIEPGWEGRVLERGEIVLGSRVESQGSRAVGQREALDPCPSTLDPHPDPVRLEIFNNLFASIAEQMGLVLQRTSVSTNVKERLDFSCAIFDADGGLVVNAPHIPVHLGAMGETVKRVLADNPDIRPGDVFVTNDPYRGGSHLPDVTIVTPVFVGPWVEGRGSRDSAPDFVVASRAHHAEIGGTVPGSMPPFSTNLGEEGVLIRNFRLVDGGESREAELRELLLSGPFPTRNVADNLADVAAQVAANNEGVRQLLDLADRHTLDVVRDYTRHIQQAAAAKMRLALAAIDDGEYAFTDHLDDGSPIAVTITIAGESATVDFTGTGPVLAPRSPASRSRIDAADGADVERGTNPEEIGDAGLLPEFGLNLNANRAIVTAAVLYVFRCLIAEDIPLNGGVLEPVGIVLPECLLNPPEHDDPAACPAIVGGNVETSQRVVDVLLGALGVAAASQGTMNNLVFGNDRFGYYETIAGGSGATPEAPGADAVHTHMTNTRLTDPEVIERRYPVRVHEFAVRRGSGGTGTHRGGDGLIRRIEFLEPLSVSMLSERRGPFAPFGLNDAEPGTTGRNTLRRAGSDDAVDLGGKFAIRVEPGDELTIETPGGGAFGSPL